MASETLATRERRGGLLGWFRADTFEGVRRQRAILGYLFLLPAFVGLVAFVVGPMFVSFGLSFYRWNIFKPPDPIGIANFQRLLTDSRLPGIYANTLFLVVGTVLITQILALALALGVTKLRSRKLAYFLRTSWFLPVLMSGAAVGVTLSYLFQREFGPINYYLGLLGIERIPWMTSASTVMWTIIITAVWKNLGFIFVIYLGAVTNIPQEILDAADVDGAQGWRRLWTVTLPLISPIMLFATVINVIGAMQIFDEPQIMTRGGPGDGSRTAVMYMYEVAFKEQEFGYGSAIAVTLFIAILIVTGIQFLLSKRWVFYG